MANLNAEVRRVEIIDKSGQSHLLTGDSPEAQLVNIKIVESIEYSTMIAELTIMDTGVNMISSIPIVGLEFVNLTLRVPEISETLYEYKFQIYAIRNRIVNDRSQLYTLDCVSPEAIANEAVRLGSTLADKADKLVRKILKDNLSSDKDIFDEPCLYSIKEIPALKRPFDVINSFLPRSISQNASTQPTAGSSSSTSSGSSRSSTGTTSAVTATTADAVVSGSAGYLFFETQKGYVFKSIDKILQEPAYRLEYSYSKSNASESEEIPNVILNYNFVTQENIFEKLRHGVYSSMLSFFNPSTLEYEEYFFDLSKEYPQMVHLGTDNALPDNVKNLSKYPSRVIFQPYDNEIFHNLASSANSGTQYPDFKKQWMAQATSRMQILNNQVLNIQIPLNFELRAGDKLNIKLPNLSVESKRKEQLFDETNSGLYLIKTISYEIIRDNRRGLIAVNNITLIRDNLGS
jgi:hypothetical protein